MDFLVDCWALDKLIFVFWNKNETYLFTCVDNQ